MKNKRHVLVFSFAYYPIEGGAEIALRKIIKGMNDTYFSVVTFCFDPLHEKKEVDGNITIYRIHIFSRLFFPFVAASFARKLHKKEKFTHIWSMMANYAGFAALFFKKKNKNIPYILTLQEGDPIPFIKRKVWFVYPWFKQIFRYADHIQAISSYLANFAKEMGFTKEVHVIPNGVDGIFVSEDVFWPRHVHNDLVLITTSRLVKKNAVDDIISALTLLPDNIKLHIIGDGEERKSLENLAQKLGLGQRITFYGHIKYEDLPKFLEKADVYIRPCRSEGLGSAFLEAMAAGLPIVGTSVGGISDFLKNNETGFVCGVNSPSSIASVVNTIFDKKNEELVRGVVLEANKLVKKDYTWTHIVRQFEDLFR